MPFLKQGSQFLYSNTSGQNLTIVGSIANAAEFLRLEAWSLKINGA